jgi:hypothetical protein
MDVDGASVVDGAIVVTDVVVGSELVGPLVVQGAVGSLVAGGVDTSSPRTTTVAMAPTRKTPATSATSRVLGICAGAPRTSLPSTP